MRIIVINVLAETIKKLCSEVIKTINLLLFIFFEM